MIPSQKEREQFYLDLLRQLMPSFPTGSIDPCEGPDFILTNQTSKIGIEITRLHKSPDASDNHLQVQENERKLLVAEALREYELTRLPCAEVRFIFSEHTSFNKKNRPNYAKRISALIASQIPSDQSWISLDNHFDDPTKFPYEISHVSIARYGHTSNFWSVSGAGWVQEDFISDLQSLIGKKNSLVAGFRKDCNAHWLVVVIDGMADSTFFEPSLQTLTHVYETSFNRIFLLERFPAKAHELRINGTA